MKDMTTLPFITMTSSLWLHLRTCLIKMKCCILRKKSDVLLLLLMRDSSKALLRHKGLGYHQGVQASALIMNWTQNVCFCFAYWSWISNKVPVRSRICNITTKVSRELLNDGYLSVHSFHICQ